MINNTTPVADIGQFCQDALNGEVAGLLTVTAQQAVLPRHLAEGVYAVLDADGAVQITETPGYKQRREHDWEVERSDRPEWVDRKVTLLDVDSFADYVLRNTLDGVAYQYSAGALELWADLDNRRVLAILDGYHGRRQHTATLSLPLSREWGEWSAIDGKLMGQVEFAQFVEDHLSTIAAPDGGLLLDVCQTLEATVGAQFRQQTILASGQRQFRYEETVEAKAGVKGDLTIPGELTLALRPFQGSEPVQIAARFRYRPGGSDGLALGVRLAEPQAALEDAFAAVVAQVQARIPAVRANHGRP